MLDFKASTRRKWRLPGPTFSAKATEAFSSNNGTEHSAVKVLLCQQLGFFTLSYSGKVDSVAPPVKLGASRAVQPGQRHISFIFGWRTQQTGKILTFLKLRLQLNHALRHVRIFTVDTCYDCPAWQLYCWTNIRSLSLLRFVLLGLLLLVHSRTSDFSLSVKPWTLPFWGHFLFCKSKRMWHTGQTLRLGLL